MIRRLAPLPLALLLAGCLAAPGTEPPQRAAIARSDLPAMKRFGPYRPETPHLSNLDIARDFLDLSFRMESGRELPWMSRFTGPVTVALTGPVPPTASSDLDALLGRFRREAHIQIHRSDGPANITVVFLPRRQMQALVPSAACFVAPRVSTWDEYRRARRSELVDWRTLTRREKLAVFIPSDTSPQEVRDCLHEEIAQALGPLDDLYRLTDSVFDDDNFHNVLTGFDMLILRAYYAPELPPGTTRAEAARRLPTILARLNPAGQHIPPAPDPGPTPRDWIDAIETALGPRATESQRRAAAAQAVAIAQEQGWSDARMAFSWFVHGRLSRVDQPEVALQALRAARAIYRTLPDAQIQRAHIDMQLAAYALASEAPDDALRLIDHAIPVARHAENAALLATLLLLKGDALTMRGDRTGAKAARLDSLGWARYGFGTDRTLRVRLADFAAEATKGSGG